MTGDQCSTRSLLLGIWGHLSQRRRLQLGLLLLVMLASGAAELLSLGAVLPFLAVLTDIQTLWQQPLVRTLAAKAGWTEANSPLLLLVILAFATAAVLAAVVRLLNLWLNSRLAAAIGSDLSREAYRRTLYQPYGVHVHRNSSTVITSTSTQIDFTVLGLFALLQLVTAAVVATGLLVCLFWIDLSVALAVLILLGCSYGTLAVTMRHELRTNGIRISDALNQHLKVLQEGLGAIRDILLDGSQETYLQIYHQADLPLRRLQARNQYLGAFPRYAVEALAMVALSLLGGVLLIQRGSGTAVVPILGALALGGQRLLPALQQMYAGWTTLKGYNAALAAVLAMLDQQMPELTTVSMPLQLKQGLRLDSVFFCYGPEMPDVLKCLTLEIFPGERLGLIGGTGSGKSTMVDILMGLLNPTQGKVLVDGQNLHDPTQPELLTAWRASIAHVPQTIYLADCSIAENIAFGIPRNQIDWERVHLAAAQAQIASFIAGSADGYDTRVGERGVRLSGGQRQRIGIARALYKQAKILVFDEATSALDSKTERAVMEALDSLTRDLTLVMIAHRLSTVANCDRVIELSQGNVVREMTGHQAAHGQA
jgi:ABC-type multidrug transport system fused ATPase/permease subunit